jgi:hypothetical protein
MPDNTIEVRIEDISQCFHTLDARFKNGVLNIVLPKSARAQSQVKRIAIKS